MRILAIEKELRDVREEEFRPHLKGEAKKVWELYQLGVLREIYFREDEPGAVLILECFDRKEAEAILATLPLVKQQLIAFEVVPLVPYSGFARLFKE